MSGNAPDRMSCPFQGTLKVEGTLKRTESEAHLTFLKRFSLPDGWRASGLASESGTQPPRTAEKTPTPAGTCWDSGPGSGGSTSCRAPETQSGRVCVHLLALFCPLKMGCQALDI